MWIALIVERVEFDLGEGDCRVHLIDGTTDRWELDALDALTPTRDGNEPLRAHSPLAPAPVAKRLGSLVSDLRDAYEDVSLGQAVDDGGPSISTECDYELMMRLAASPSLKLPPAWQGTTAPTSDALSQAESLSEPPTDSSDPMNITSASPTADTRSPQPHAKVKPSPPGSDLPSTEADEEEASTVEEVEDEQTFSGKLLSRRRPTSFGVCKEQLAGPSTSARASAHDLLSLVHLLTRVREALLDLFSLKVIPLLRAKLECPTFAIWAAKGAERWSRTAAQRRGAQVSRLVLELLDDDGDQFDQSESSEEDELESELDIHDNLWMDIHTPHPGEAEWEVEGWDGVGFGALFAGGKKDERDEERERRLERRKKRNVFYAMRDDFELRKWCERANTRPAAGTGHYLSDAELDEQLERESECGPHWVEELLTWEVSRPYPRAGPPRPAGAAGGPFTIASNAKAQTGAIRPGANAASAKAPARKGPRAALGDAPLELVPNSSPPTSDDDSVTSEESEPELKSRRKARKATSSEVFEVEDPLGENLLPKKLPWALVKPAPAGTEMEHMRQTVHQSLNEIAGLQRKMVALRRFVEEQSSEWETLRNEERAPKSIEEAKPKKAPLSTIPLAAQPLRLATADKAVSKAIRRQSNAGAKSPAGQGPQTPTTTTTATQPRPASPKGKRSGSPSTSPPRKRQKQNLASLATVIAASQDNPSRQPLRKSDQQQLSTWTTPSQMRPPLPRRETELEPPAREEDENEPIELPAVATHWQDGYFDIKDEDDDEAVHEIEIERASLKPSPMLPPRLPPSWVNTRATQWQAGDRRRARRLIADITGCSTAPLPASNLSSPLAGLRLPPVTNLAAPPPRPPPTFPKSFATHVASFSTFSASDSSSPSLSAPPAFAPGSVASPAGRSAVEGLWSLVGATRSSASLSRFHSDSPSSAPDSRGSLPRGASSSERPLLSPKPRRGSETSAFATGSARPAWLEGPDGEARSAIAAIEAEGQRQEKAGLRLSPDRLGGLRRVPTAALAPQAAPTSGAGVSDPLQESEANDPPASPVRAEPVVHEASPSPPSPWQLIDEACPSPESPATSPPCSPQSPIAPSSDSGRGVTFTSG